MRLGTSIYVISWFDTSFDLAASIITLFYEYAKKILKYSSVELELGFAILPVMIVYLLLSKYIVRGVALGSVKG